jgi:hypothetical protein
LSVDAVHPSESEPAVTLEAARFVGAVGGCLSGALPPELPPPFPEATVLALAVVTTGLELPPPEPPLDGTVAVGVVVVLVGVGVVGVPVVFVGACEPPEPVVLSEDCFAAGRLRWSRSAR